MCDTEVRFVKNNHGFPYQAVCHTHGVMSRTYGERGIAEDAAARHREYPNGVVHEADGWFRTVDTVDRALPFDMVTGERV